MTDRSRPSGLRTETLALLVAVFFTLACNFRFWGALMAERPLDTGASWLLLLCTGVAITGLQWLLMLLVVNRWTVKPLLILLLLCTASAVYFMTSFGVYLDKPMLRNLLETDVKEASELVEWKMLPWLIGYGLIPAWLVWRCPMRTVSLGQAAVTRLLAVVIALAMVGGGIWPVANVLIPTLREHKEMRALVTPTNYLVSTGRVIASSNRALAGPVVRETVGADAHQRPRDANNHKPLAIVLVVGETTRAANWGLSGYSRQTTPELAKLPVINFTDVTSCGTDTATSVPCMFSAFGRHDYDEDRIRHSDSVLHLLDRAGISVLWRDNQSGCKGVCADLASEDLTKSDDPALCNGKRCFDEILINGLSQRIDAKQGDTLIVLHMLGGHGPAYFERYPDQFRRWTPTCDTTDLASCSHEALINTYDNVIAYSDHVLAQLIATLATISSHNTALIFISDHGESLGEKGLYLHGMPLALAPSEQTHVPMVMWFADATLPPSELACVKGLAAAPYSHDHLFHTLLGLFNVETTVYQPQWDILSHCRSLTTASQ